MERKATAESAMTIDCVIVNYNDAKTVEKLVRRIENYRCFDRILIVDNASTDDSPRRLEKLCSEKVILLSADHNGGYGAGNNLGVGYAAAHHATHVVIANPDVSFDESCVLSLARLFQKHPKIGVASAVMREESASLNHKTGPQKKPKISNAWKHYGFVGQLLFMGPVSRRLFAPLLFYPQAYFRGKKAVWVYAVHGSMLMADTAAFLECGGYDEKIFLYQEETVLADRMKAIGRRTALLLTHSYRHEHSASINKSYQKELARQKLREESVLYYMKHYLSAGRLQETVAKIWFWGIRTEVKVGRFILSPPIPGLKIHQILHLPGASRQKLL